MVCTAAKKTKRKQTKITPFKRMHKQGNNWSWAQSSKVATYPDCLGSAADSLSCTPESSSHIVFHFHWVPAWGKIKTKSISGKICHKQKSGTFFNSRGRTFQLTLARMFCSTSSIILCWGLIVVVPGGIVFYATQSLPAAPRTYFTKWRCHSGWPFRSEQ